MFLHHVQLSMRSGEEALARNFYVDGLGFTEWLNHRRYSGAVGAGFERLKASRCLLKFILVLTKLCLERQGASGFSRSEYCRIGSAGPAD